MAWNAAKPAGADKIKDSDNNIRLNNAAIETVLGTNITAGPTTIQGAIQGDTTKGRKIRNSYLNIDNGTNGVSLKCSVLSLWNGDAIAETDDIIKDATTGNFSLSANGDTLTIEASGLTGNCIAVIGKIERNYTGTAYWALVRSTANDIIIKITNVSGTYLDITGIADVGILSVNLLYFTDA